MPRRYTPILSDKRAELHALASLDDPEADIRPLIHVRQPEPPKNSKRPWSPDTALTSRVLDPMNGYVGCWGGDRPLMLDIGDVDFRDFERGTADLVDGFFDVAASTGLIAVPVVRRDMAKETRDGVARSARRLENGAAIRLRGDDAGTGLLGVAHLLRELDLPRSAIDLVVDMEAVPIGHASILARIAAEYLTDLEAHEGWRSVALVSSSFPRELYKLVEHDTHAVLPRIEYDVWKRTVRIDPRLEPVRYGDYGVVTAHPDPGYRGAANLRYAVDGGWLVLRGFHPDKAPIGDHARLARQLITYDLWRGEGHCPGCAFILEHAQKGKGGNPGQWRQADFAHHFTTMLAA